MDKKKYGIEGIEFLADIISQICDYAVDNDLSPNDMLVAIAEDILEICVAASFEFWDELK